MLLPLAHAARAASRTLARLSTEQKNAALYALADALTHNAATILAANAQDVAAAQAAGLNPAMLDRLTLTDTRLTAIARAVRNVAALPDPVGEVFEASTLPNGLRVHKQRVPLGVLGVIYEARPNVTVDVATLALKTGNAAILRGGSETLHTNRALVAVLQHALAHTTISAEAVQFIDSPDRALVLELLRLSDHVDMIIPRGGAGLHQFCRDNSRIPVITGGIGICHLFVDDSADLAASLPVIFNAKTQRPTVCNALDTVLIHRAIAAEFLPQIVRHLALAGVSFRADEAAWKILVNNEQLSVNSDSSFHQSPITNHQSLILPAGPNDFDTEWLALILGLKVVENLDDALAHIAAHSTAHSDGILTRTEAHAARFIAEVDSAAVYVNASTRFTDGSELGLGAEVAISTQRLHARGPMGLRELTTYKWVIQGEYHVRA
jgi:glutamate-5-semialdehyde dehydrogenase